MPSSFGTFTRITKLISSFIKVAMVVSIMSYVYPFITEKIIIIYNHEGLLLKSLKILLQLIIYDVAVCVGFVLIFPTIKCDSFGVTQFVKKSQTSTTQTGSDLLQNIFQVEYDRMNDGNLLTEPNKYSLGFKNRPYSSVLNFKNFDHDQTPQPFINFELSLSRTSRRIKLCDLKERVDFTNLMLRYVIEPFTTAYDLAPASRLSPREVPLGILLTGNRKTGIVSSIMQAVFNEIQARKEPDQHLKFYKVDGANCIGPVIGFGVTFRDLFHYLQQKESALSLLLILIENIENLQDRSISAFLSEMSSAPKGKILVFATTTNRSKFHHERLSEMMEEFDFVFELDFPNLSEREEILKIQLQKRRHISVQDEHVLELAKKTSSFSRKELEKLVELAQSIAIDRWNNSNSNSNAFMVNEMKQDHKKSRKTLSIEYLLEKNKKFITQDDLLLAHDSYWKNRKKFDRFMFGSHSKILK